MRRLRLVGVAAVGLLALGACGSEQGAALFVGDERVTESTIDGYVDGTVASYLEQGATMADISYADNRQQAALIVLFAELGREIGLPAPQTGGAADEYEALYLEAVEYHETLSQRAEPRAMTKDELEALNTAIEGDENLLQRIVQEWAVGQNLTQAQFQEFGMAVQSDPGILTDVVWQWAEVQGAQMAGFADDLNEYVEEYDISLNPRYGELDISPLVGVFEVEIPQR
ncbi:hypothetical protein K3N28_20715 [Glycomyces sp. TRM65418]|uniref:hypothetical protein n=1 Tax=Glycomyces sp. TRM65418 TaxID=2867006 RepID=UPI001D160388|nr:hypothetical protein [Glycomyces sp. TRM65418]MCC3765488.1 hypothetical protein [Glycomyces sp. TRM65418]